MAVVIAAGAPCRTQGPRLKMEAALANAFRKGRGNEIASDEKLLMLIAGVYKQKLKNRLLCVMMDHAKALREEGVQMPTDAQIAEGCGTQTEELITSRLRFKARSRMQKLRHKPGDEIADSPNKKKRRKAMFVIVVIAGASSSNSSLP